MLDKAPAWPLVKSLLLALNRAGFTSYLVGGAVRDLMRGNIPGDMDILTCANPDEIVSVFPDRKVRVVGSSFSVTLVDGVEVASCRGLSRSRHGHPINGNFPSADLALRDLTVNSMALDPFSGEVVDPWGGQQDLSEGIVRFTGSPDDRILEDPLRMVRACRFAAALDGRIEQCSLAAITAHKDLLQNQAAPERLRSELLKSMSMERPSQFFVLLHDTGLLAHILPCLDRCWDLDGGPNHGETVFEHCMLVGDGLSAKLPLLRLAGFLHDAGKYDAAEFKNGALRFHGHETHDAAIVRDLEGLKFSNKEIGYVRSLVRAHMRPLNQDSSPKAVRRLLAMLDALALDYRDFLRLRIADKGGNLAKPAYTLSQLKVRLGKILAELDAGHAFAPGDLAIGGKEICDVLHIPPGPRVGQVKAYLFEQVLGDPSLNTPERLADLVREYTP